MWTFTLKPNRQKMNRWFFLAKTISNKIYISSLHRPARQKILRIWKAAFWIRLLFDRRLKILMLHFRKARWQNRKPEGAKWRGNNFSNGEKTHQNIVIILWIILWQKTWLLWRAKSGHHYSLTSIITFKVKNKFNLLLKTNHFRAVILFHSF